MVTPAQIDDPGAERAVLTAVGLTIVGYSQLAFVRQAFGAEEWRARYPFQKAPKLNIAGALADANAGRSFPLARRFDDRPAGTDTGELKMSIAHRIVASDTVEVGSSLDYATRFNFGGTSTQKVSPKAKQQIAKWITKRPDLADKLSPLLDKDEHETEVVGRPFVGWNPELEALVEGAVKEALEL